MNDKGSIEGQPPLSEQQKEAIHLAALQEEVFTLLGKEDGGMHPLEIDPITKTKITKGDNIDTPIVSNAPGPGRIFFGLMPEGIEGVAEKLGIESDFMLEVPTAVDVETGKGNLLRFSSATFFFDSSGNFAKVVDQFNYTREEEPIYTGETFFEDETGYIYFKCDVDPGDFELAGHALNVVKSRLQSFKDQGMLD